ncbi:MAG: hypothetical protein H3C34_16225, partial [Caldilineaceae bacterium]|nr:hypothetical protein [Caldilineaceae bacterium]
TSQRFKHAPDYYFCSAVWLLANEKLGSTSTWWEGHAWYSERWPGGSLPIVRALRGEPKRSRLPSEVVAPRIALRGTVAHGGSERQLIAEQDGVEVARTMLDEDGYFELADLSPGRYVLHLANTALRETIELRPDQQEVVVRLALAPPVEVISRSVVTGTVHGGAGAVIMLVQKASGEEWVTMAKDDGGYRFIDLPPGEYSLRVHPAGTQFDSIVLDGRNTIEADLALAGWGYTVRSAGSPLKAGAIVVTTPGYKGLHVQVHGQDWASDPVETGTAPDYGDEACLITPLDEGHYIVTVNDAPEADGRQVQLEARAFVDKRSFPLIEFVYTDLEAKETPHASAVVGRVLGRRSGEPVRVILVDDQAQRTEQTADAEGRFAFQDLQPGRYAVAIAGFEASTTEADIALDGRNEVRVELTLPAEGARPAPSIVEKGAASVIAGIAPDAAGRQARLVDAVGNEQQQAVDAAGRVCFDRLPAGSYSLFIDGGYVENKITVDGLSSSEIHFAPLVTVWEASTVQAGSMPGFSVLRVEVEGMASLPVRVVRSTGDTDEAPQEWTANTLAVPERGAFVAEFKPLGPGLYLVEPEGLGVHTTVELSGLEAVWVTFRRRSQPVHANVVQSRTGAQAATGLAGESRAPSVYLYIAGLPQDLTMQMALLRLTAEVKPQVGSDFSAALEADRVLLFAPEHVAEIQAEFLAKGVEVEVVNERLRQLAAELGG